MIKPVLSAVAFSLMACSVAWAVPNATSPKLGASASGLMKVDGDYDRDGDRDRHWRGQTYDDDWRADWYKNNHRRGDAYEDDDWKGDRRHASDGDHRPPGWSHGNKRGWNGKMLPPGLQKKYSRSWDD